MDGRVLEDKEPQHSPLGMGTWRAAASFRRAGPRMEAYCWGPRCEQGAIAGVTKVLTAASKVHPIVNGVRSGLKESDAGWKDSFWIKGLGNNKMNIFFKRNLFKLVHHEPLDRSDPAQTVGSEPEHAQGAVQLTERWWRLAA